MRGRDRFRSAAERVARHKAVHYGRRTTVAQCGARSGLQVERWEHVDCPVCLQARPKEGIHG